MSARRLFTAAITAQHPAAVIINNNKKFRSFKSKENIHKKEVGPYRGFGYSSLIMTLLIWQKEPEEKTVNLQI